MPNKMHISCCYHFNRGFKGLPTHLTDTTALPFDPCALFIILFYLIREEGIKDLVHQLSSSRFSWPLTVLLYLCRVTNGLSSSSSPVNRIKLVFKGEIYSSWHKYLMICGAMAL